MLHMEVADATEATDGSGNASDFEDVNTSRNISEYDIVDLRIVDEDTPMDSNNKMNLMRKARQTTDFEGIYKIFKSVYDH